MPKKYMNKLLDESVVNHLLDTIYHPHIFDKLKEVKKNSRGQFWGGIFRLIEKEPNIQMHLNSKSMSTSETHHYLNINEAQMVCDVLYQRILGKDIYEKMIHLKISMGFQSETDYMSWLLELVAGLNSIEPDEPECSSKESILDTASEIPVISLIDEVSEDIRIENVLTDTEVTCEEAEIAALVSEQCGTADVWCWEYRYDEERKIYTSETVALKHSSGNRLQYKCGYCDKHRSSEDVIKRHIKTCHLQRKYKCTVCGKCFVNHARLEQHTDAVHHKKFSVNCDICHKTLMDNRSLARHKQTHITNSKKLFNCDFCQKSFCRQQTMDRHFTRFHLDKTDYMCDSCGKKFAFENRLKEHKKRHEKEGVFNCVYCSKKFFVQDGLLKHIAHVHLGSRKNTCNKCSLRFNSGEELTEHKLSHTKSHQCDMCDKRFVHKVSLKKHKQVIHLASSSKYKCEVCGVACYDVSALANHRRKHTREKPFVCEYCSHGLEQKRFTQKSALNHHIRLRHSAIADISVADLENVDLTSFCTSIIGT